ncbi:hypothetical protein CKAH01_00326 [Colletotrichum kahawae]|uniref:Uncharacterized protein n=1 Tax=Colletotrichum kahawae TaxID=34407 RepID=A0AAD9YW80_COLKA|nr:hypothetical protein CKAH01_00326 [Colletotrichum kahawae]
MLPSFNFSTRSIPQAPGLTLPLLALVAHTHARTLTLTPPSARDALTLPSRETAKATAVSVSLREVSPSLSAAAKAASLTGPTTTQHRHYCNIMV